MHKNGYKAKQPLLILLGDVGPSKPEQDVDR
jgi:hypothetical protein